MKSFAVVFTAVAFCLPVWFERAEAAPTDADYESCRHNRDLVQKAADCARVIAGSRDPKILLRAHNTRGLALCDSGHCADAVPDFNEVIRLNPLIAGYFDNRARALRAAARIQDAIADSDEAIRLAPTYAFTYIGKALALETRGAFDEALAVVQKAASVDPRNAGLWEYRGSLLGKLGRFSEAYVSYDRSMSIEPGRPNAFVLRAETERLEGRFGDALEDLKRYPSDGKDGEAVAASIKQITEAMKTPTQRSN